VILLLAEITQKKYLNDETGIRLAGLLQQYANDPSVGP